MTINNRTALRERTLYIIIIAALAIFGFYFVIGGMTLRKELGRVSGENRRLTTECDDFAIKLSRAEAKYEALRSSYPGLRPEAAAEYRRRGLADPEQNIIDDLGGREELWPFRGVFGARPSFYSQVRLYVLNPRWAFGSFYDGHNFGYSLLEYRVAEGGKITWKVLEKYMERTSTAGVPTE